MTINSSDIKLLQSERMNDTPNGGGRMSGTVIVDGDIKNIFSSLADLDSAYGNVSARKAFMAVQSNTTDVFYGANVILAKPPVDPLVDVVMFDSASWVDRRQDLMLATLNYYLNSGVASISTGASGNFYPGNTSITVLSPDGIGLTVGKIYKIINANSESEFIKPIAETNHTVVNGLYDNYTYTLESPLLHTCGTNNGTIYQTTQSLPTFYGVQPIVNAVSSGDSNVVVAAIYVNLVSGGGIYQDLSDAGINPAVLPLADKAYIFKPGNLIVLHNTVTIAAATYSNGQTVNCSRTNLADIKVRNSSGVIVAPSGVYTTDLAAGTLNFSNVAGLSQPLTIEHRIEDVRVCDTVASDGTLHVTVPISRAYGTSGTYVSSALVIGDMQASVTPAFDQQTWTGVWSDTLIGSDTLANFNDTIYPIVVTNQGAIEERWVVLFDSSTNFRVIGETVGQIASGTISGVCNPNNPITGVPYFSIPVAGWGSGWSAGNCLRFNTVAANYPLWLLRIVKQGTLSQTTDGFNVLMRGNKD